MRFTATDFYNKYSLSHACLSDTHWEITVETTAEYVGGIVNFVAVCE